MMVFDPGLNIGDELKNDEIVNIFQCGNMGGMRRSKKTGTLVIISDYTKGLYQDVWKNGVLHYTGMGKIGDQVLEGNQNGTLFHSDTNGVEVHLFEVIRKTIYTYCGKVKLADKPYIDRQTDDNGNMRNVWMFPVRPTAEAPEIYANELPEKEIAKLSDRELARRSSIKIIDKTPKTTETKVYYRDPYLKQMVKRIADGKCQYCGEPAPFADKNGEPYLEEHHIERLADGGSDTIDNVVALCPNCHRRMHILKDANDIIKLHSAAEGNAKMRNRLLAYENEMKKKI